MTQVITFENYTPTPRYDGEPWTEAIIQEALTADAVNADWTTIETITLSPVDADPENPASRDLTTDNASDTAELWYRIIFRDADGSDLLPTVPVQNVAAIVPYASTTEFFRLIKVREPSDAQVDAAQRALLTAAGEINSEIDLDTDQGLAGWQVALAAEVNLARAMEHWEKTAFGLVALGVDIPAERTAQNSWERHALKLAPLKARWGFA
jgi:hypothetical protein